MGYGHDPPLAGPLCGIDGAQRAVTAVGGVRVDRAGLRALGVQGVQGGVAGAARGDESRDEEQ